MFWKKGWIENRLNRSAKINQLVDFRILRGEEFQTMSSQRLYSHTGINHGGIAQMMAKLLHCEVADLSNGNILVCGQDPIQKGYHLEVQLTLSHYDCKMRFLVEAAVIQLAAEMKEMVFSAGIKIMSVNKDDIEMLNRIIDQQKNS